MLSQDDGPSRTTVLCFWGAKVHTLCAIRKARRDQTG